VSILPHSGGLLKPVSTAYSQNQMAERFFQELLQCQELDQSGCYSYDNCLKKVEIYINIDKRHESTNYKNHVLLIDFITASNKPFGLWNTKLNYKQNDKRKRGR
jgi:hypothetical protein